jgi:hypothetical protein
MKRMLFAAALFAAPAAAHEAPGRHGGVVTDVGPYHAELVAEGATIHLYLTNAEDRDVPAAPFKATAILIVDGKAQRVTLAPSGGNRLSGSAPAPIAGPPKGAVQIQSPEGGAHQGKF